MRNGILTIQQSGLTKCGYTISNDLTRDSGRLDGISTPGQVFYSTPPNKILGKTHTSIGIRVGMCGRVPGHQIGGFVSAAPLTEPKNYCGPNRCSDIFGTTPGGSRLDGQTSVIDDFRYSMSSPRWSRTLLKSGLNHKESA